ncbi:MAG TPA: serine protein kinase PrkA [Anaeromyxobacteraceae bacterium]|nr:serine protein kinase PrkA [Anaeromyxobacteraceae bacterium]
MTDHREGARRFLASVGDAVKGAYAEQRSLLSFEEYLEVFLQAPRAQARSAAQYVRDALDHFGTDEVESPVGSFRRWRAFDLAFEPGARAARVAGQEEVQQSVYRALSNFVRLGRVNKLILLHGPNGSAKSSFLQALGRATEAYSHLPGGALYRYLWVFPSEKKARGGGPMGFGPSTGEGDLASFAHLEGDAIEARLACPLKDHPLLLLPRKDRRALLERACLPGGAAETDFVLSDHVLEGQPCSFCQQVWTALLGAYHGDVVQVFRHVQVERFYVSARYQQAVAAVEPQLRVDAELRQVSADRSHAALPRALQSLSLFEPWGPLVAANRGVLDFADLLKRPPEAFKYLLGFAETGRVSLDGVLLDLDVVLVGSTNEEQLAAYQEHPELRDFFRSFQGRLELVRVPYLRRFSQEREIYDAQISRSAVGKHIAPHATEVAARWAVLTRLKKPVRDRYAPAARAMIDGLTPSEKLRLYDRGQAPDRFTLAQAKELRKLLPDLYRESDVYPHYEGRTGVSAREVKTALYNAAQSPNHRCLTPLAVLDELAALCRDASLHSAMREEVVEGYHDPAAYVREVEGWYLDVLDEEIRDAMGLVSESQYRELFGRYVTQVSHWVKGERIRNRITGADEPASEERMTEFEGIVMPPGEDRAGFRRAIISAIGAFRLDHPDAPEIDLYAIFPDLFRRLRDHYHEERKRQLRRSKEHLLQFLSEDRAALDERTSRQVAATLERMRGKHGYCEHCAQEAILFLLQRRYE